MAGSPRSSSGARLSGAWVGDGAAVAGQGGGGESAEATLVTAGGRAWLVLRQGSQAASGGHAAAHVQQGATCRHCPSCSQASPCPCRTSVGRGPLPARLRILRCRHWAAAASPGQSRPPWRASPHPQAGWPTCSWVQSGERALERRMHGQGRAPTRRTDGRPLPRLRPAPPRPCPALLRAACRCRLLHLKVAVHDGWVQAVQKSGRGMCEAAGLGCRPVGPLQPAGPWPVQAKLQGPLSHCRRRQQRHGGRGLIEQRHTRRGAEALTACPALHPAPGAGAAARSAPPRRQGRAAPGPAGRPTGRGGRALGQGGPGKRAGFECVGFSLGAVITGGARLAPACQQEEQAAAAGQPTARQ